MGGGAPRWVRPSAMPRLALCPASGVASEGQASATSDAAERGTAWHRVRAILLERGREAAEAAVGPIAASHLVDAETLHTWLAATAWTPPADADWSVEHPLVARLGPWQVAGTADLVIRAPAAEVQDEKTGDPEHHDESQWLQLATYGVALGQSLGVARVRLSLRYVRLGEDGWMHRDLDVAEAEAQLSAIVDRALAQIERAPEEREYRTGEHCAFCPARAVCPARTVELRAFAALAPGHAWAISADNAAAVHERARAIERVAAAAKNAVREYVRTHGPVPAGPGKELRLITTQRREYIVPAGAVEQLRVVRGGAGSAGEQPARALDRAGAVVVAPPDKESTNG